MVFELGRAGKSIAKSLGEELTLVPSRRYERFLVIQRIGKSRRALDKARGRVEMQKEIASLLRNHPIEFDLDVESTGTDQGVVQAVRVVAVRVVQ